MTQGGLTRLPFSVLLSESAPDLDGGHGHLIILFKAERRQDLKKHCDVVLQIGVQLLDHVHHALHGLYLELLIGVQTQGH